MKIEMGESLIQSFLKHTKNCLITQSNWKTSSSWNIDREANDRLEHIYSKIKSNNEFSDVFKKNELAQILRQAEIDVLGIDKDGDIHMVEVAFHEGGLNYGSKIETKNKIFEKLLRSLLIGSAYFAGKKLYITFATPKTNPATKEIIIDYFEILEREFGGENVNFNFITNEDFKNEILTPTLKAGESEADTAELFLRTYKMLNMFDLISDFRKSEKQNNTPMNTFSPIRQVVSQSYAFSNPQPANTQQQNHNTVLSPPKISFYIAGQEVNKNVFRNQLLITKQAKRTWMMSDGRQKEEIWNAQNFTEDSDLMANIKTSATYRNWKQRGIVHVRFDID